MADNREAALAYVEEVYKDSEDALEAISTVQHENRVRISSIQPALPMLDLHGISRAEVHGRVFNSLQEKLLEKVDGLDGRGLAKLLGRCFQYIGTAELRNVCLQIMQRLPEIDEKYLLVISENHQLYSACPLEVKRQIWQTNQGFFGEAVSPLLDQYIAEKESIIFSTHDAEKKPLSFLSLLPKARRQSPIVQELVHMVGPSLPLYTTLLQFLRTLFLRTHICHYCTLRADILMTLHDRESKICDSDGCHKFAWCLDACIRVGHVDSKKSRELYSFLDGIEAGDEIIGDVAMLLRDPYSLNAICKSILQCLLTLYDQSKIPRESRDLESLLRLLQLGLKALVIMDTKDYREDLLAVEVMVKFLPELMTIMVENSLRGVCQRLKEDHTPYSPSRHFLSILARNSCAMHIACSYALHLMEKRELRSLTLLLPAIATGYTQSEEPHLPDVFLHLLVLGLTRQQEPAIREATLHAILKDFWLPCCRTSEPVLLHFCRLLWTLHSRINKRTLHEILEAVRPNDQLSQVAHEQYETLLEHVHTAQTEPLS